MRWIDSRAEELTRAFKDRKRRPFRLPYFWTLLDPNSRVKGDGEELTAVYNGIVGLWNRLQDNKVQDVWGLEDWEREAVGILERHRDLTDRHESLHYHPWFLRITRMRATIPVLLQYKCDRCAGDDGPCHLPEVQEPSHSKPTVACTACRNAGHPCSWERSVPYRLYQLKAAILREYRDPTATGPAAGDHVRRINAAGKPKPALNLSRKALRQLSDVTFTALAEVEVRLQETFEEEIVEILDSLAEIYN